MQCWPEDGWIDPEPPRWGWGTVALALAALALSGGLVAALAHQAPSGWRYDYRCCGDYDCAPLAPGAAREVTGGYRITIAPGSHPSVPADAPAWTAFVPHGDPRIEASGDDRRHACIGRPSGRLICLYIAPGGV